MKYTKKISVGAWLKKGEDYKDGEFITIANEGKEIPGEFGMQDAFMVKLADGREGNVGFNQTTINNLIDSWGDDSISWIGKKVKVWGILQNVKGKMTKVYYFLNPEAVLDESSGEFVLPKKITQIKSDDIPVIEDNEPHSFDENGNPY